MRYAILLFLTLTASAQTLWIPEPSKPPVLKCGQYQHVEPQHIEYSTAPSNASIGTCERIVPAQCVDDVHMVTEREWQQIMKRLDELEFKNGQTETHSDIVPPRSGEYRVVQLKSVGDGWHSGALPSDIKAGDVTGIYMVSMRQEEEHISQLPMRLSSWPLIAYSDNDCIWLLIYYRPPAPKRALK